MGDSGIKYRIEPSSEGAPTMSVTDEAGRSVYLHSRIDPLREAGTFAGRLNPEKYDTLIILGCALGYHCLPVKDNLSRYTRIIIIDPLQGIEGELEKNAATRFLVSSNINRLFGLPAEEVQSILPDLVNLEGGRGVQVLEHVPSLRAFPAYYGVIKKTIARIINKQAGNLATVSAFGARYLRNCLLNLRNLSACRPVSCLQNSFPGRPAMVITSGPSLEDKLPTIARIHNSTVVISVDSALPVLSRAGIRPDIVVSIDPQPHIHEHFHHSPCRDFLPVYALSSHPLAVAHYPGLISLNSHPLAQLIEEMYPEKTGSIDSRTGTVTGDALACARYLGCTVIALIGFDSSFPGFSIYARGSAYQRRFGAYFQNRTSPIEKRNLDYIMTSSRKLKRDGLHTRRAFLQYRELVEGFALSDKNHRIISISPSGLPMEKVTRMEIGEFEQMYCRGAFDKTGIIGSRLDAAPRMNEIIELTALEKLLRNTRLREELVRASLTSGTAEALHRKTDRYFEALHGV
ncbi:MAG: DUF115 domain-containing protein [Spirochaetes bacterium]|nr:MAG: DUF115 domain-containing protein [Spirochaetota bacterium]